MRLQDYFNSVNGVGVLATADADGKVDVAVYSRPHFFDDNDGELAFIMNDRLSHDNIEKNPHAAYLFVEATEGYAGKRLFLTKTREETDQDKIESIRRRNLPSECGIDAGRNKFLVHFQVDGVRPLVGTGE